MVYPYVQDQETPKTELREKRFQCFVFMNEDETVVKKNSFEK